MLSFWWFKKKSLKKFWFYFAFQEQYVFNVEYERFAVGSEWDAPDGDDGRARGRDAPASSSPAVPLPQQHGQSTVRPATQVPPSSHTSQRLQSEVRDVLF